MTPIVTVILVIIVAGVILWAAKKYIPMDPAMKNILTAVVVIAALLYVLKAFGVLHYLQPLTL